MSRNRHERRDAWARLRFTIVSPLLASPPESGALKDALCELAGKVWRHPVSGDPVRFGFSTIERWYYAARSAPKDPIGALRARPRADRGRQTSVSELLAEALRGQHREHSSWSYTLHAENLLALSLERPELAPVPSVSTLRRWMKANGLYKQRRRRAKDTDGALRAAKRFEHLEVRSYESSHVHALWHLDFHRASRRVLTPGGRFAIAHLLGILDDRSRLCCHAQWYLAESAEALVHGLCQALAKRGLPRELMTDNGSAMKAAETQAGLVALGIEWRPTLSYSPYQNGKQEVLWSSVEGRLLAMLEGERELTLALLNEATQAWVEHDYNRSPHSEIGMTPLERALIGPSVARPAPSPSELRAAFRQVVERKQRRSDGTFLLEGRRFEVPSRFGHRERLCVRYARWDLSVVELWDPLERVVLARLLPQDKERNAEGLRRPRGTAPAKSDVERAVPSNGMAPLLRQMIEKSRSSGLPPAYLPTLEPPSRTDRETKR